MPQCLRSTRAACLLLLCLVFVFTSCSSNKAGLKSPELPAKHWLEEAPGIPVENRDKLQVAVSNLYNASKVFSFDDCVFLTIQQSPVLVDSAVTIETRRLQLTDTKWAYLPELRLLFTVSNNLTQLNSSKEDKPGDYGKPKMQVGFYAPFPNPLVTYFDQQMRKVMVNIAITAHRKAVGEVIYKLAQSYVQVQIQRKILAAQKEIQPLGKELVTYWHQVESVEGRQGVSLNTAKQHERELDLNVDQAAQKEVMEHTRVKVLAGVEPTQRLNIDVDSLDSILAEFDGNRHTWEERWPASENEFLLRSQIKLADANIIVAWAQYLPNMTISVNNSPPSGQYTPPRGHDDTFVHLNFDFPLVDWGHRYRGVQTARMDKARAFHKLASERGQYSNEWLEAEQRVSLAATQLKLAKVRLETAEMQYKEARIGFNAGTEQFPLVSERQEALGKARVAHAEMEGEYKLAKLRWMYVANFLQERFLGLPAGEL